MAFSKSALAKGALVAALAGATVAATASAASADVVCNRWGDCWHVHARLDYPATLGVIYHPDDWGRVHMHGHWKWLPDNDARGYYDEHGVWITF